jgi:hypothetical protein
MQSVRSVYTASMHARKELESRNNYHVALHPRDCAASRYMALVCENKQRSATDIVQITAAKTIESV